MPKIIRPNNTTRHKITAKETRLSKVSHRNIFDKIILRSSIASVFYTAIIAAIVNISTKESLPFLADL